MNGEMIRSRLEIDRPDISDEELEQAWEMVQRYFLHRCRFAKYWVDTEAWENDAAIAMVEAARRYDPKRHATYRTYATSWAKWLMYDSFEQMQPLGAAAIRGAVRAQKAGKRISNYAVPLPLNADPDAQEYHRSLIGPDDTAEAGIWGAIWSQVQAALPEIPELHRTRLEAWLRSGSYAQAARECRTSRQMVERSVTLSTNLLREKLFGVGDANVR